MCVFSLSEGWASARRGEPRGAGVPAGVSAPFSRPSYGQSVAERGFRAGEGKSTEGVSILGKCAEGRRETRRSLAHVGSCSFRVAGSGPCAHPIARRRSVGDDALVERLLSFSIATGWPPGASCSRSIAVEAPPTTSCSPARGELPASERALPLSLAIHPLAIASGALGIAWEKLPTASGSPPDVSGGLSVPKRSPPTAFDTPPKAILPLPIASGALGIAWEKLPTASGSPPDASGGLSVAIPSPPTAPGAAPNATHPRPIVSDSLSLAVHRPATASCELPIADQPPPRLDHPPTVAIAPKVVAFG